MHSLTIGKTFIVPSKQAEAGRIVTDTDPDYVSAGIFKGANKIQSSCTFPRMKYDMIAEVSLGELDAG